MHKTYIFQLFFLFVLVYSHSPYTTQVFRINILILFFRSSDPTQTLFCTNLLTSSVRIILRLPQSFNFFWSSVIVLISSDRKSDNCDSAHYVYHHQQYPFSLSAESWLSVSKRKCAFNSFYNGSSATNSCLPCFPFIQSAH